jgi:PAS domain S-box-containing protein
MTYRDNLLEQFEEMRRAAERKAAMLPEVLHAMSPEEIQHTVHELQVHQIELEMQNENLRLAYVELDALRARYFDLYDLAPVGYVTVSEKGLILEANLTAATMLDVLRSALVNHPLFQFIFKEDHDVYYLCRKQLFETGVQQCELRMLKHNEVSFWVHLRLSAVKDESGGSMCRIIIIDITERKQMEAKIKGQMKTLELENECMVGRELRMIELKNEINVLLEADGKPKKFITPFVDRSKF